MKILLALVFATLPAFGQATIKEACAQVKMDCSYNSRYDIIDTIYQSSGQIMFDNFSNPYTKDDKDDNWKKFTSKPRFYVGTADQNAKLARNILANKALFVNGKLTTTAAKKWKIVK